MNPVLILGAGAAVARDLAINRISVCIIDTGDVAGGATSRFPRLNPRRASSDFPDSRERQSKSICCKAGQGSRGRLAIKAALPMYDRLSRSGSLPPHEIQRVNYNTRHSMPTASPESNMKPSDRFRWRCSCSD